MEKSKKKKVVVVIPTYNERDNIRPIIHEILSLPLDFELVVLIVDDDSPDGTGEIAKEIAAGDCRVEAFIRKERRGRGAAGIAGFKKALELGADFIMEMDGDFSHQPQFIPMILANMDRFDVVIGSRFVKGGKDLDRGLARKAITFFARRFIKLYLRIPTKDVSSGFRCYRREVLENIGLDELVSHGPSLVTEILYKVSLGAYSIGEVPIIFVERSRGKTKLSGLILLETLFMVIRFKKLFRRQGMKRKS